MTKKDFVEQAKPLTITINGKTLEGEARLTSGGSVGFYINGKVPIDLPDGTKGTLQIGCNATVCKSKEWESGDQAVAA